ncbi:DUF6442 family protein [Bifidobacterium pullorum]|uniref:DUF6442 family protein n=2 Tax=Bifidobacterium pullorum TaxID=78448 RepID=UPI002941F1DA|nr:DUF6442 family protein [Bifidobacterium pullorum]
MDRDEILEKGRKDNRLHDEGALDARQKGQRVGFAGFMILIAVVIVYNTVIGIDISLPVGTSSRIPDLPGLGGSMWRVVKRLFWRLGLWGVWD